MTEIKKTYKNYVGGSYVRSESGKTFTVELKNQNYESCEKKIDQIRAMIQDIIDKNS